MTRPGRLRRGAAVVATVALAASVLAGCTPPEPDDPDTAQGSVTADGVRVELGGIVVTGDGDVAADGTLLAVTRGLTDDGATSHPLTQWATGLGDPVQVTLGDDQQPASPLALQLPVGPPPDGDAVPGVARVDADGDVELLPATYDPDAGVVRASTDHLSLFDAFWFSVGQFSDAVSSAVSTALALSTPRPACAGQSVSTAAAGTVALPETYFADGDGAVWPCLEVDDASGTETLALTLTSNAPLPYLARATGGPQVTPPTTVDVARAAQLAIYRATLASSKHSETLLVPTTSLTLEWPTDQLPVQVALRADPATHLAYIASAAVLTMLDGSLRPLQTLEAIGCLDGVVTAATGAPEQRSTEPPGAALAGEILGGALGCVSTFAGSSLSGFGSVVLASLTAGVGALIGAVQGVWREVTGTAQVELTLTGSTTGSAPLYSRATSPGISGNQVDVVLAGQSYPGSTTQWVGCFVFSGQDYALDGATRLTATFGYRDFTPTDLVTRVRVLVDEVVVHEFETTGDPTPVDVLLPAGEVLRLEAHRVAGTCDSAPDGYAVWGAGTLS